MHRGGRSRLLSVTIQSKTLLVGIQGPLPTGKESAMKWGDENMDSAYHLWSQLESLLSFDPFVLFGDYPVIQQTLNRG